jgi:outer membrane protein
MKKSIQYLLAVGAFASAAFVAQAQPAPKIAVVDMAKLYDSHWKTQDQMAKLKSDQTSAQTQYDQMTKDLNALKAGVDELVEQAKNPTATPDAVKKAQDEAQTKYEQLQARVNDRNTFQTTVQREFQQRMQNFHDLMMEEIGQKAIEAAKSHGATLLLDKSGITVLGAKAVLYSDPSFDVTDEVAAAIAKDKPATATTPAAAPAAGAGISLPPLAPAPAK